MTEEEKMQKLYLDACEKLDDVQSAIHQLLALGQCGNYSPIQLIEYATSMVQEYDLLSPEERERVVELGDALMSGEVSLENAVQEVLTNSTLREQDLGAKSTKASNSKKPLLN